MGSTHTIPEAYWDYLEHAMAWVRASLALVGAARFEEISPHTYEQLTAEIQHRQRALKQLEEVWGTTLPVVELRHRWHLSNEEVTVLLFALAQRLDPAATPLFVAASGDGSELSARVLERPTPRECPNGHGQLLSHRGGSAFRSAGRGGPTALRPPPPFAAPAARDGTAEAASARRVVVPRKRRQRGELPKEFNTLGHSFRPSLSDSASANTLTA